MTVHRKSCDVLVIGSGMAGIRAGIEAYDQGANVTMVSSKRPFITGASFFFDSLPWGMMTAGEGTDAADVFCNEVIRVSHGALNPDLVRILAEDSNAHFADLEHYGVIMNRLSKENRVPCFGSKPRGAQLNDFSNLVQCMQAQLKQREIAVEQDMTIVELLVQDHSCFGAIGLNKQNEYVLIEAGSVILATGGAEYLWKHHVSSEDLAGDGHVMALRNGASLTNLEFIQFIPASVNTPKPLNFHTLSLASVDRVYNAEKKDLLQDYLPEGLSQEDCLKTRATHGPFSNEDDSRYFDIALFQEAQNGEKGAFVAYSEEFFEAGKYARWKHFLKNKHVNVEAEDLKIYPHCQGFNGGIVIDTHAKTEIDNLYACGECAGGPHGANRMGGNAILATQVFGKLAGQYAAQNAKCSKNRRIPAFDCRAILRKQYDTGCKSRLSPEEIMNSIKIIMDKHASIVRSGADLHGAILKIREMRNQFNAYESIVSGKNMLQSIKAQNALIMAQSILCMMERRKESRGSHYRIDYPSQCADCSQMNRITLEDIH